MTLETHIFSIKSITQNNGPGNFNRLWPIDHSNETIMSNPFLLLMNIHCKTIKLATRSHNVQLQVPAIDSKGHALNWQKSIGLFPAQERKRLPGNCVNLTPRTHWRLFSLADTVFSYKWEQCRLVNVTLDVWFGKLMLSWIAFYCHTLRFLNSSR